MAIARDPRMCTIRITDFRRGVVLALTTVAALRRVKYLLVRSEDGHVLPATYTVDAFASGIVCAHPGVDGAERFEQFLRDRGEATHLRICARAAELLARRLASSRPSLSMHLVCSSSLAPALAQR
ncbi:hypothetical protein ABZ752_12060 [Streptomyces roseifaciens]